MLRPAEKGQPCELGKGMGACHVPLGYRPPSKVRCKEENALGYFGLKVERNNTAPCDV